VRAVVALDASPRKLERRWWRLRGEIASKTQAPTRKSALSVERRESRERERERERESERKKLSRLKRRCVSPLLFHSEHPAVPSRVPFHI
jgi:hypothetical protein